MSQIAVTLPDGLLAAVDELVAEGSYASRSGAVRAGLEALVRQSHREQIDEAFVEGFRRHPEGESEVADAHRMAVESIEDEPWERWW